MPPMIGQVTQVPPGVTTDGCDSGLALVLVSTARVGLLTANDLDLAELGGGPGGVPSGDMGLLSQLLLQQEWCSPCWWPWSHSLCTEKGRGQFNLVGIPDMIISIVNTRIDFVFITTP